MKQIKSHGKIRPKIGQYKKRKIASVDNEKGAENMKGDENVKGDDDGENKEEDGENEKENNDNTNDKLQEMQASGSFSPLLDASLAYDANLDAHSKK